MTDRELLEMAAKAAGYTSHGYSELSGGAPCLYLREADFTGMWAPLTDDGDALRLAVKLELSPSMFVSAGLVIVTSTKLPFTELEVQESFEVGTDPYAPTRRAIVRAAAAIQAPGAGHATKENT